MMKGTETGTDKVKKICDILRRDTLEPALEKAEEIIQSAEKSKGMILDQARREAVKLIEEAKEEIRRQQHVFQSSLNQACKQALERLKQEIETKIFDQKLFQMVSQTTQDPNVLAQIVEAVVRALHKEGLEAQFSVYIPAAVSPRSINALLGHELLEMLKNKSVLVGSLTGGVEVKLHQENVTIDISDVALKEIVANYIRKDFRHWIFST